MLLNESLNCDFNIILDFDRVCKNSCILFEIYCSFTTDSHLNKDLVIVITYKKQN